jgi:prepilin-type N-terminal cleavage/methylation domain-containing protein
MSVVSTRWRDQAGFTLVETLVSLAVLTLALVALVQIFGIGFRGVRLSESDTAALHLATLQLARAGTETPLSAGQQQGTTSGGLEWSVVIEPYVPRGTEGEASSQPASRAGGLEAYWVTAEVRWQSSAFAAAQTLSLTTLKIRTPP